METTLFAAAGPEGGIVGDLVSFVCEGGCTNSFSLGTSVNQVKTASLCLTRPSRPRNFQSPSPPSLSANTSSALVKLCLSRNAPTLRSFSDARQHPNTLDF